MKHYKIRKDLTKNFNGTTLYRIELTTDCQWGKKGDLGGWIENENNLFGDAWVYGNARVSGGARVYGDAWVSDNAQVYGNARVHGNARVYGDAWVHGDAWVSGNALVSDNAQVYGYARVSGNATKTPVNIIGTKYNVTICDNEIVWGCRVFDFDELKLLELKDCKENWDQKEFEMNKKMILNLIEFYRK